MFQTELGASQSKSFTVQAGERKPFTRDQYKVYGRFIRERHDDFAWENDRIAHRMYGRDLETWAKEPLTSSGIDIWVKRVTRRVINDWYMIDDYHRDNGDGGDFYSVGKTRGCGGLGTRYAVVPGSEALFNQLTLDVDHAALARAPKTGREVAELCAESELNDFEVCRALKAREPSLSIPCFAERRYGGVLDDEMLMALPPEHLAKAIAGMEALARNGFRYPFPQYGIQQDVRDGMAKSYPDRAGGKTA